MSDPSIETPDDVAWQFHPAHAAWSQSGFRSWGDVEPWVRYQFPPDEARAWNAEGFAAEAAAVWFFYGFTSVSEAVAWRENGFADPHEAHPWHEHNFVPEWAAQFRDQQFTAEEADPWASFDVNPVRARDLHDAGLDPELGYEDMRRKGGDPGVHMKTRL